MHAASQHGSRPPGRRAWILAGLVIFGIGALAAAVIYWMIQNSSVYIDSSMIEAPVIVLSPQSSGTLQQVFVTEGDDVAADQVVAQVGNELIKTKTAGVITGVTNQLGAQIASGQDVVEMIDPSQLRVVGKIDEDKGLSRLSVGDLVSFTVDAFGGKQYSGVVDEISPTSVQSGVVFNISDQRPTQQFAVEVRFDESAYPELRNGMSARMWIYPHN